jgi:hypothetical protein
MSEFQYLASHEIVPANPNAINRIGAKIIETTPHHQYANLPLTSLEITLPKFLLAELNTHKVISKSAASSRAIPVANIIKQVREDPFVVQHWGLNQAGMQSTKPNDAEVTIDFGFMDNICLAADEGSTFYLSNVDAWKFAGNVMADIAEGFNNAEYHKQIVNRLLEPWMWAKGVITSSQWNNFFKLRVSEHAEPHFKDLAVCIKNCIDEADKIQRSRYSLSPLDTERKHWHLPYVSLEERSQHAYMDLVLRSGVRCARVSYKNQGVVREDEPVRAASLRDDGHWGPFEHQAKPMFMVEKPTQDYNVKRYVSMYDERDSNLFGWDQARKYFPNENGDGAWQGEAW